MLDIYFKAFEKYNVLGVRNIAEKRQSGKILNRVNKKDTGRDYSLGWGGGLEDIWKKLISIILQIHP